ncbi:MAG: 3-hydroxyacyl-CoA dehydrogenase family protein [Chitinophagaceae bacterium]
MKIAVIANDSLKEEWMTQGLQENIMVEWLSEPAPVVDADCYIDLLFQFSSDRINLLRSLPAGLVVINSVLSTLNDLPDNFIRINGWPTLLKRPIVESSCRNDNFKNQAESIFAAFNKLTEWVPDVPGFITARVISMIVNEAYFSLDEKVSGKKEIDTAMKLGTNYPFGPFEWSQIIGLKSIYDLLVTLSKTNARFESSSLLKKEALSI